ncbi:MAG TPA: farnesyl diphosphate synthase [Acidobacteriota bacterium]|nr:farnesyl diphosphate synthase [Acidobacteriota bacterium]
MGLPVRFEDYIRLVNEALAKLIPSDDAPPVPIHRAMRYSVFAGGKRMRPILCLAAAESLGAPAEQLMPVACAIEMVHTYSLIHDDLPAMDNDDFRRGKLTNHKVFGEAIAILAGDALLTYGLEALVNADYDPEIRCRLVQLLTQAVGTCGMIGGQVLDMENEAKNLSRNELELLHSMKTAALIRFSSMAPSVVLRSGESAERAFSEYGANIGLAFQIVDDVLDVESTTAALGKTAGKDVEHRKVTYPSLIDVPESKRLAAELTDSAMRVVAPFDRHGYLEGLARFVLERKS